MSLSEYRKLNGDCFKFQCYLSRDDRTIDNMQAPSSEDLRSTPSRSSSIRLGHSPSPIQSHRQSFTESLRGHPPSPRSTRQPSLSQAQLQELLNNPPTSGSPDPRFSSRDWQTIGVGELCDPADLRWVEFDTGIEDATNVSCFRPLCRASYLGSDR